MARWTVLSTKIKYNAGGADKEQLAEDDYLPHEVSKISFHRSPAMFILSYRFFSVLFKDEKPRGYPCLIKKNKNK